jgi:APA family basic amino acid/polyamine antiporter
VLPSLLMLWRYTTSSGLTMFTHLVGLTVVFVAIPYLFSACAQLTYLVSRCRPLQRWLLAQDLSISIAAGLFSLWVAFAARVLGGKSGRAGTGTKSGTVPSSSQTGW